VNAPADHRLLAFRIVQLATLTAVTWKLAFFAEIARDYFAMPLRQRFFPPFFESPLTITASYLLVIVALASLVVMQNDVARRLITWMTLAGLSILCLHQGSYNDATFTAAWWTTLWSAWFAPRIGCDDPRLMDRAARLSRAILSLILLGGAAGKWTSEYWSGQVLYEIYFVERDFWLFNLLRSHYEGDQLRQLATWYSRQVIVVETLCGLLLWALPRRLAAIVAMLVFTAIALLSNFYLFSVVLSLVGLASVGLLGSSSMAESKPDKIRS
jgi:hypothetical protein